MKNIGGQALFDGIIMYSKTKKATAIRNKYGRIRVRKARINNWISDKNLDKIFILRGILITFDSIFSSFRNLNIVEDFEDKFLDKLIQKIFKDNSKKVISLFYLILSFFILSFVFLFIPLLITYLIKNTIYYNLIQSQNILYINFILCIFEYIFRIIIIYFTFKFLSKSEEIEIIFKYHGAEHKTINCYENNLELEIENIRKSNRFHKRCGTNFISVIMIVSVFIFSTINYKNLLMCFIIRLILLPIIIGVSNEIMILIGKYDNLFLKIISYQGMIFQNITTKEPDDSHIEVAIKALRSIL